VKQVIAIIENDLEISPPTLEKFANMTEANLKTAANIFIYIYRLYSCRSSGLISRRTFSWFSFWSPFYYSLFKKESPDKIILTLNRMIRTNPLQSKKGKVEAFLKRITTILILKYEKIQNMLPQTQKTKNLSMIHDFQYLEKSEGMPHYNNFRFEFKHCNVQCLPMLTIQCTL